VIRKERIEHNDVKLWRHFFYAAFYLQGGLVIEYNDLYGCNRVSARKTKHKKIK